MERKKRNVPYIAVGLILFVLSILFFTFSCLETFIIPNAASLGISASLMSTVIVMFLREFFLFESQQNAIDTMEKSSSKLDDIASNLKTSISNLDLIRIGNDYLLKGVDSIELSTHKDYEELFANAQTIDFMCHTGGSSITGNQNVIKNALKNGARIRVLVNSQRYDFFNPTATEFRQKYQALNESFCPGRSISVTANVLEETKNVLKKLKADAQDDNRRAQKGFSGQIEMLGAECIITCQIIIIDSSRVLFIPYIPYTRIDTSIRLSLHYVDNTEFVSIFKDSFQAAWDKASRNTNNWMIS